MRNVGKSSGGRSCGGCGRPIGGPAGWLCTSCGATWDAAIELQTNPLGAADALERAAIAALREGRG